MSGQVVIWLQKLAAQPYVEDGLAVIASSRAVQVLGENLLGSTDVAPHIILASILVILICLLVVVTRVEKFSLAVWGWFYFFVSGDKRLRKPNDDFDFSGNPQTKKIIFIRHGESEWNYVFNKGFGPGFPVRLVRALISEFLMIFDQDSLFFDSPLSREGLRQAMALFTALGYQPPSTCDSTQVASKTVKELDVADLAAIVRGDIGNSIVVSSILKRAISTGLLALSTRLLTSKDKVYLMTMLQEISRNVDTQALTPAGQLPQIPRMEANLSDTGDVMSYFYKSRLDKKLNRGNKTLGQTARHRHEEFAKWVFAPDQARLDCIIVCGHSIWFREFFKAYLPKSKVHEAKSSKIVNCGCIAFDLCQNDQDVFGVRPDSIKVVHGGFEQKKKQSKRD